MSDIDRLEHLAGQLHQGAKQFSDAAQTLRQQAQRLDWSAQDLAAGVDSWAGAGSKAFQAAWQNYHANTQKSATALDNTSQALTKLAQKIDDSVQRMRAAQAMQTAGFFLTAGLVVLDVVQLGLDPVTDAATVGAAGADVAAAGEADAAATAIVEADAEIGAELDQIVGEIENVSDAGDIPFDSGEAPGDINFDNVDPEAGGGSGSGNDGGGGGGGNGDGGTGGNGSGGDGINGLKNTGNFRPGSLDHIFKGDLKGTNAGGYHYEGVPNTGGSTVPGTETPPNEYGVYQAKVTVNGVPKSANGGYSTFFPKSMSPQEVVDGINEAYRSRSFVPGTSNTYEGQTSSGMTIIMYLDSADQIISAFPAY